MATNGINGYSRLKVCVFGAGASGLCAGRHLASNRKFQLEIYERSDKIGGTWNYTDCVGKDDNGCPVYSSMYKNLRTNLPMEIMQFPDFEWTRKTSSFVRHEEVLDYLKNYAKHFDLYKYIKFNHSIKLVKRTSNEWQVTIEDLKNGTEFTKSFDAILVCNGRYSKPNFPRLLKEGIKATNIRILHSHDYRKPDSFKNQKVFILGAGPSGIDICLEIAEVAGEVYLCHQLKQKFLDLPANINQISAKINSIGSNRVKMSDGSELELDSIVFATGYDYDYDFLDESCSISVTEEGRVLHTYLHQVNIANPSMAIWAIPQKMLPFPFFNQQVKFYTKVLLKEVELPTKEEMLKWEENDFRRRTESGIAERHAHKMFEPFLWELDDQIASLAKIEPISSTIRTIYDYLHRLRDKYSAGYKNFNLYVDNDTFEFR